MINQISIKNFKSIENLDFKLGRITVLIGENGSGKSNILEAITFLGAAAADKLDREFLVSRGIRVTEPALMTTAFLKKTTESVPPRIQLSAKPADGMPLHCDFEIQSGRWTPVVADERFASSPILDPLSLLKAMENDPEHKEDLVKSPQEAIEQILSQGFKVEVADNGFSIKFDSFKAPKDIPEESLKKLSAVILKEFQKAMEKGTRLMAEKHLHLSKFLVYAPENSALRRFEEEQQIDPIGIRGEGLFKMIQTFGQERYKRQLDELKQSLELIGWFVDFSVPTELAPGEYRLKIIDRYLGLDSPIDQRSANEGFLFLLFYFSVILSPDTPSIFAIDNIDSSLNPKLCSELMRRVCELAKGNNKQIVVTTHNPAILDGLNLHDPDQRLYTVFRNEEGRTRLKHIPAPKLPPDGRTPLRLSEAFLRGFIGGLPKNF